MAKRGTSKRYSVEHEEFVARKYGGRRTPSSGAADNDSGDVRAPNDLIECKMTGKPGEDPKRSTLLRHFEKIAEEAHAEGRSPVVALRFWCPDSALADINGWVDLAVRTLDEDAYRGSEVS
jgi:hypothetical protein